MTQQKLLPIGASSKKNNVAQCFYRYRCTKKKPIYFQQYVNLLNENIYQVWHKEYRLYLCSFLLYMNILRDFFFFFFFLVIIRKRGGGIWTLNVFIENTIKCQLNYKTYVIFSENGFPYIMHQNKKYKLWTSTLHISTINKYPHLDCVKWCEIRYIRQSLSILIRVMIVLYHFFTVLENCGHQCSQFVHIFTIVDIDVCHLWTLMFTFRWYSLSGVN